MHVLGCLVTWVQRSLCFRMHQLPCCWKKSIVEGSRRSGSLWLRFADRRNEERAKSPVDDFSLLFGTVKNESSRALPLCKRVVFVFK